MCVCVRERERREYWYEAWHLHVTFRTLLQLKLSPLYYSRMPLVMP